MSDTAPNYEVMSIEQLNAINDDFDRQLQAIRAKREALNVVRKRKVRLQSIVDRLGNKIKGLTPETLIALRDAGQLPAFEGTTIVPGVAEAKGAAVKA
jgi:hypothetical protein